MSPRRGRPESSDPRDVVVRFKLKEEERAELDEAVTRAGLTLSEFIRRRIFGMKIIPRVEEKMMNELRRLGGMQKHLMEGHPESRAELNVVLKEIVETLQRIRSKAHGDR